MKNSVTPSLPTLSELFSASWVLTTQRWASFVKLWLLQFAVMVLLVIGGIAAALSIWKPGEDMSPLDIPVGAQLINGEALTQGAASLMGVGAVAVVAIVAFIVIGVIFQGAAIALATAKNAISAREALKIGKKKWVTLALAGIISGLMVLGAMGLFIVPGIILSILFTFVMYEVVVGNQSAMTALSRSAGMVHKYFWPVVGRIAAFAVLSMGVNLLFGIVNNDPESAHGVLVIGEFIVQTGVTIFSLIYSAVLYQAVKKAAGSASLSMTRWTTVSLLGWVLLILLAYSVSGSLNAS